MISFLANLFAVINKVLGLWHDKQVADKVSQDTIKAVNEAINENVAKAQAAVDTPDPARTLRLRDRFGIRKDGK